MFSHFSCSDVLTALNNHKLLMFIPTNMVLKALQPGSVINRLIKFLVSERKFPFFHLPSVQIIQLILLVMLLDLVRPRNDWFCNLCVEI